jgi:hypothetical protein
MQIWPIGLVFNFGVTKYKPSICHISHQFLFLDLQIEYALRKESNEYNIFPKDSWLKSTSPIAVDVKL